jgi:hypothetical protein
VPDEYVDPALKTSAVVTFLSDEVAPLDALTALGLPTDVWRTRATGEPIGGGAVLAKTNSWKLDSPLDESADVIEHAELLLSMVESVAEKLATLQGQVRIVITVYWTPSREWRLYEFSVDAALASRLARCGAELAFVWIPE